MKVALTYNLKTGAEPADAEAEWDDLETIRAVEKAIARQHEVILIEADSDAPERFAQAAPDLVFNMAEGKNGVSREAQIPAILELLQIPYTGSDPLTLALCLDKSWTKDVLAAEGVAVPLSLRQAVSLRGGRSPTKQSLRLLRFARNDMNFPLIVKPRWEGSSKGVANSSLVRTAVELKKETARVEKMYRQPALVEEFLPGREFTVALLGNGGSVEALPIVEVRLDALPRGANKIYSFEAKWEWDTPEKPLPIFDCPAKLPKKLEQEIAATAKKAFQVLGCRDWARIDVRLDAAGVPRVIEVNPLPGILPDPKQNSCFPKAARAAGLSYDDLILRVLDLAAARTGLKVAAR